MFHADAATKTTTGTRGKTTGRKSTRTVRGPEGAYRAQVKEDLIALAPEAVFLVMVRSEYVGGVTYNTELFRCPTREVATEPLAQWMVGKWTDPQCTKTFGIVEVQMKWVLTGNGGVKREVVG